MLNPFRLNYRENIFIDWLLEVVYFPVWWYTIGFYQVMRFSMAYLRRHEQRVSFLVWLKNIFVPMYGQTDIVSRLVSFLVRSVQVVVRGLVMIVYLSISFAFVLLWLALPVVAIFEISNNLDAKIF